MKNFGTRWYLHSTNSIFNLMKGPGQNSKQTCSGCCSYPGASRTTRFEKSCDTSESPDGALRTAEITKNPRNRDYATSATTTSENIVQEMPEPHGLPLVGTLLSLMSSGGAKKLHEYVDKRHEQLGPVYREQIGPVKAVFVNSPHEFRRIFRLEGSMPKHFLPEAWVLYNEIRKCRRGLLFMDGEEWLHFRRILNKVMLVPDPTESMVDPCQKSAQNLAKKWKKQIESHDVIMDLENQLYQWSIEVMLATLMGSSWHRYKEQLSQDAEELAKILHDIFKYSADLSMVPARLAMNLRLSSWNNFVKCVDRALEIVRNLVPQMIELGGDGILKKMMDEGIRDDDAACIVTDFILAAGDTTATSMQWMLLLLCKNPEWQDKLCQDINELSLKETLRNSLLKGVIKEALRLYPIAPFISRYLADVSVIGNYVVPKGELILLSTYSSGHEAANFPQPNEFLPERWTRTEQGTYRGVLHPHASLPFALGARSCIGRKLAETQISLALAEIVKTFKIECVNKSSVKMILHLISVPSESIQLKLSCRDT